MFDPPNSEAPLGQFAQILGVLAILGGIIMAIAHLA